MGSPIVCGQLSLSCEPPIWRATKDVQAGRLRDLLDILPVPSEELSFLAGEASVTCFDEVRRCYLDGSNMAVVLLCLAYVERELAVALHAAGWEAAKSARLGAVPERAYESGVLSELEWRTYCELVRLRNSHAHFREPGSPMSMMARAVRGERSGCGSAREGRAARDPGDSEDCPQWAFWRLARH